MKSVLHKELLCFDLDNTLVYATEAHMLAFQKAFAKYKLKTKTEKEILKEFSLESCMLVHKLYPKLSHSEIKVIVKAHDEIFLKETKKKVKAIHGAKETLLKLRKHYKLALLSNSKRKEMNATIKQAGINPKIFSIILGNDQVKHPKPAPDEIIKTKHLLKIKNGYMIGDSIYDIRAGKRAKLKTIAVCTGPNTKKQLQKEKPNWIIKSVAQLSALLSQSP